MDTLLLESQQIGEAVGVVRGGGLLVFPTETVYGLGASAWNAEACANIFAAKGRPADNPLIVHISGTAMLGEVAAEVPQAAWRLFDAFSPGPLTVILLRGPRIPDLVTAGLDSVGVRIPSHPVAQALLKAAGMPIAAPSANRSGRPSPTDFPTAVEEMDGRVDAIIDGGPCDHGLESTIIRVAGGAVTVLREGAVTREMIRAVLPDVPIGGAADEGAADTDAGPAVAPGMRHAHYRPRARLLLAAAEDVPAALRRHGGERTGYIGFTPLLGRYTTVPSVCVQVTGLEDYGRRLYRSFYLFDREGCEVIIAELPPDAGLGRALRDRLTRAAG
jgi:L-threonylcarbamoyladenylate synthase